MLTDVDLITKHVGQIDNKIKKMQVKHDAPEGVVMENIPLEFREKIEGVDTEIKRLLG
jgi:Cu/Ag efflux protein CusF